MLRRRKKSLLQKVATPRILQRFTAGNAQLRRLKAAIEMVSSKNAEHIRSQRRFQKQK